MTPTTPRPTSLFRPCLWLPLCAAVPAVAQCALTGWLPLGGTTNGAVHAVVMRANGDVVSGGRFTAVGGVAAAHLARFDGVAWSPLGAGVGGGPAVPYPTVRVLATLPNGDVIAGGDFTTAGGIAARGIARWDGAAWLPLGAGTDGSVWALLVLPNGDLIAGGAFTIAGAMPAMNIARWNGVAWSPLGGGVGQAGVVVESLARLPNGDLVAGGEFLSAGGVAAPYIARWNGVAWSGLGTGMDGSVRALRVLANGDLIAGGLFGTAGGVSAVNIARWNGTAWSPLPGLASTGQALWQLPDGDLVAGTGFGAFRWTGAAWTAVGAPPAAGPGGVAALIARADGTLLGGGFSLAAGCVAALTTPCPATATPAGAGCPGSAGPNVLVPTALPWTGSTYRALATGLPANSVAIEVLGSTPWAVPLSGLLPQGLPGCTLLAAPDVLGMLVPAAGVVATALPIPDSVALAGVVCHQQVVALEFAALAIVAATATNALTVVLGTY